MDAFFLLSPLIQFKLWSIQITLLVVSALASRVRTSGFKHLLREKICKLSIELWLRRREQWQQEFYCATTNYSTERSSRPRLFIWFCTMEFSLVFQSKNIHLTFHHTTSNNWWPIFKKLSTYIWFKKGDFFLWKNILNGTSSSSYS